VTKPAQPHIPKRARRERQRSNRLRRALLLVATIAVFGLGAALGLALDQGSGAKGTQTCERTLRLVTVTVTNH
jgi:hypothetical protein